MNRVISLVLILSILCAFLPMNVFADETNVAEKLIDDSAAVEVESGIRINENAENRPADTAIPIADSGAAIALTAENNYEVYVPVNITNQVGSGGIGLFNHITVKLHAWISNDAMGSTVPEDVRIGDWIYLNYELLNENDDALEPADYGWSYVVSEYIYNTDGSLRHSNAYENSRESWIGVHYTEDSETGLQTAKVILSGDVSTAVDLSWYLIDTVPQITSSPASRTVSEGHSTTFSVRAVGTNLSYQWFYSWSSTGTGTAIDGATDSSYTIDNSTKSMDGRYYYCQVSNYGNNSVYSNRALLSITDYIYTITYDANGGTGAPAPQSKTGDETITLSSVLPTRFGYTFAGWAWASQGFTTATHMPGQRYSGDVSLDLSAVWEPAEVLSTTLPTTATANIEIGNTSRYFTFRPLTSDVYVFQSTLATGDAYGYLYTSDGAEIARDDDSGENANFQISYSLDAGTLYYFGVEYYSDSVTGSISVKLSKGMHTVTYDYATNGGSSATKTTDYIMHGDGADLAPTATKDGWEFVGWNTDKNATTALSSYTVNGDITLYAIYKKVIRNYFVSGAKTAITWDDTVIFNRATTATVTMPTPTGVFGWTTVGWRDDTTAGAKEYSTGQSVALSGGKTFHAVYSRTLTLSYDANGGVSTPASQTVTQYYNISGGKQSKSFTLAGAISREGYTFKGWALDSATGTVYAAGSSISLTDYATMYAVWEQNVTTYTVTYDYVTNGGTSVTKSSAVVEAGQNADLTPTAAKEGWTFVGWNTDKNATSALSSYIVNDDVTLYAIYKKTIYAYFVSGSGKTETTQAAVIYNRATTGTVTSPMPSGIGGWTTVGWRDDTTSGAKEYSPSGSVTINDGKRFYAVYSRNLTLSYHANGGGSTPASQTATQYYNIGGSKQRKSFTLVGAISRNGYTFKGWALNSVTGTVYAAASSISLTDNATMYAVWESTVQYCTVTYDYATNGGTSATKSSTVVEAGRNADLTPTATKEGWTFVGWNTDKNGTKGFTNYRVTEDVTLYAIYKKDIDLRFYSAYRNMQQRDIYTIYNNQEGVEVTMPEPDDYEDWIVDGWRTDCEIAGPEYVSGEKVTFYDHAYIHAVYHRTLILSYDSLGGSPTPPTQTARQRYNADDRKEYIYFTIAPAVQKDNYHFKGWRMSTEPVSYRYPAGSEIRVQDHTILYAAWEKVRVPYAVTYDYATNGGSSSTCETATVLSDDLADLTPIATKAGWEFVGWNTDPDATTALSVYRVSSDVKLYAIYRKALTGNFYSCDNKLQETKTVYVYNNNLRSEIIAPTPDDYNGWEASGWKKLTEDGNVHYLGNNASITMHILDEIVDFYAVYMRNISLSYDSDGGNYIPEPQTARQEYLANGTTQNVTFTLAPALQRDNYVFKGWAKDGINGELYDAGSDIRVTGDTVMYAVWESETIYYTVTYDYEANDGISATKTSDMVEAGQNADLTPTATKTGWEFVGWNTDQNAQGALRSCTVTGDVTLYAIFSKEVSVTCYGFGGIVQQQDTKIAYNGKRVQMNPIPEPNEENGWQALYWADERSWMSIVILSGIRPSITEDCAYYAIYSRNIAVNYIVDGMTEHRTQHYQRHHAGLGNEVKQVVIDYTPEKKGYIFEGWKIENSDRVYWEGDEISITEDLDLHAVWSVDKHYCGDNITWSLIDGVLTLQGEGAMCDFDGVDTIPWYSHSEEINQIRILEGITYVGNNAFSGCYYTTAVRMAPSVSLVAENALEDCYKTVIYGQKGSYAETYADEYGVPFMSFSLPEPQELVLTFAAGANTVDFHATLMQATTEPVQVYAGLYDANNRLLSLHVGTIEAGSLKAVIPMERIAEAAYAKAFAWDAEAKPVTLHKTAQYLP